MNYHVFWMTKAQAEAFDRRIHRVPDNHGLGWIPYRIRVTKGTIAHKAFVRPAEFRRWLRQNGFRLVLTGRFLGEGRGTRSGRLVQA